MLLAQYVVAEIHLLLKTTLTGGWLIDISQSAHTAVLSVMTLPLWCYASLVVICWPEESNDYRQNQNAQRPSPQFLNIAATTHSERHGSPRLAILKSIASKWNVSKVFPFTNYPLCIHNSPSRRAFLTMCGANPNGHTLNILKWEWTAGTQRNQSS